MARLQLSVLVLNINSTASKDGRDMTKAEQKGVHCNEYENYESKLCHFRISNAGGSPYFILVRSTQYKYFKIKQIPCPYIVPLMRVDYPKVLFYASVENDPVCHFALLQIVQCQSLCFPSALCHLRLKCCPFGEQFLARVYTF